jgi:hypothetical protein
MNQPELPTIPPLLPPGRKDRNQQATHEMLEARNAAYAPVSISEADRESDENPADSTDDAHQTPTTEPESAVPIMSREYIYILYSG